MSAMASLADERQRQATSDIGRLYRAREILIGMIDAGNKMIVAGEKAVMKSPGDWSKVSAEIVELRRALFEATLQVEFLAEFPDVDDVGELDYPKLARQFCRRMCNALNVQLPLD